MTAIDFAALVGAAAWLPQILTWAYRAIARPRVRVFPDKNTQIGFTTYGPIFNIRMAISAEQKDTVIDGIHIELKHESGSTHRMDWAGITETFSEIIGPAGIRQTVQRETPALAIKLSVNSLQDKFIRFQEQRYHDNKIPLENAAYTRLNFLRPSAADAVAETLASSEVHEYVEFHKRAFWWKAGTYKVSFGVSSPDRIFVSKSEYTMHLLQSDVDALSSNIGLVKDDLEYLMKLSINSQTNTIPVWNWRTAALRPVGSLVKHRH